MLRDTPKDTPRGTPKDMTKEKNEIFARLREMGCSEEDIEKIRVL